MLNKINYKGDWFICVQEDEEHLEEYKNNFGEKKIITYNYYEEIPHTDFLDNFSNENRNCGVVVVRNIIPKIAKNYGCERYWIFDDDITNIRYYNFKIGKWRKFTGEQLEKTLNNITHYANNCNIAKIGFFPTNGGFPPNPYLQSTNVIQIMNMPVDLPKFKGRVSEDDIHNFILAKYSYIFFVISWITFSSEDYNVNKSGGGLNDLYQEIGSSLRASYILIYHPTMKIELKKNKIIHHTKMTLNTPKLISEHYKKGE